MALKYNNTRFSSTDVEIIERALAEAGKPLTGKQLFNRVKSNPNFCSAVKLQAFSHYVRHGAIKCSSRYALYDLHQGDNGQPVYAKPGKASMFVINRNKPDPSEERTNRLRHPNGNFGPRLRKKTKSNNEKLESTNVNNNFPPFIDSRFISGLINRAKSIDEFWFNKTSDQKRRIFYDDLRKIANSFLEENES